jgi:hypothetical protein
MTLLHRLTSIVRWLTQRDQAERELDEEMQAFVELSAADKVRQGIPPAQARRLAVLELGGVEQTKGARPHQAPRRVDRRSRAGCCATPAASSAGIPASRS